MKTAITTFSQAIGFYQRVCHVPCRQTAAANRISGLCLIREALIDAPRYRAVLQYARDHGEAEPPACAEWMGIRQETVATIFLGLWKEAIEWRAHDRTQEDSSERIFFERRKVTLKDGGMVYRYRLSALGELVMRTKIDAREIGLAIPVEEESNE
jgi:hypothetical protein